MTSAASRPCRHSEALAFAPASRSLSQSTCAPHLTLTLTLRATTAHLSGSRTMSLNSLASRKSMSTGNTSSVRASSIAMLRAALMGYIISICGASTRRHVHAMWRGCRGSAGDRQTLTEADACE